MKKALCLTAIIFLTALSGQAFATGIPPYNLIDETWDNCSLGNVTNCHGWEVFSWTATVTGTGCEEGYCAAGDVGGQAILYNQQQGDETSDSYLTFYFYSTNGINIYFYSAAATSTAPMFYLTMDGDDLILQGRSSLGGAFTTSYVKPTMPTSTWAAVTCVWADQQTYQVRMSCAYQSEAWSTAVYPSNHQESYIKGVQIYLDAGEKVDDIYNPYYGHQYADYAHNETLCLDCTDFFPNYPVDGMWNQEDCDTTTLSVGLKVNFSNLLVDQNASDTLVCYNEYVSWVAATTSNATTVIYTDSLGYNEGFAYYDTIDLPKGGYRVEYTAKCYWKKSGSPYVFTHFIPGTGVGCSEEAPGNIDWWGLTCDPETTYNACIASSTSWSDKMSCRFENIALELSCPSPETLARSRSMISEVQGRFPFSYMNLIKDIFYNSSSTFATSGEAGTTTFSTSTYTPYSMDFLAPISHAQPVQYVRTGLALFFIIMTCVWAIRYSATEFHT